MSEEDLPEGWGDVPFGDLLVDSQNGCSARAGTGTPTVVLRLADVSIDGTVASTGLRKIPLDAAARSKYSLEVGDLLAFRVNGSPGIAGRVICYPGPEAHAYCDHFIRFRIDRRLVAPPFVALGFQVPSVRQQVEAAMVSSAGQNTVSQASYREIAFPVPPLAEQRRIVAKVEALLAQVNAARAHLAKVPTILKRFRQAILSAACSGRLTEDWRQGKLDPPGLPWLKQMESNRQAAWSDFCRERGYNRRYQMPIALGNEDVPEIPATWKWVSADEVCSQVTDGEHVQPRYQTAGKPMLTATHVRDGFVVFEGYGLIAPADFNRCLERCAPKRDDVLIVSVGATTGRAAIVQDEPEFAIVRSVLLLRPLLLPRFLLRWVQSPWCYRWMTQASGASAQPHFYIGDAKRMPVPLPPPAEQHEIVRRVDALFKLADAIEARVAAATARADKITQAILAKAFRGEIVPTEAELARQEGRDYEPASALLARIRAARAAGAPVEHTRTGHVAAAGKSRRRKTSIRTARNR